VAYSAANQSVQDDFLKTVNLQTTLFESMLTKVVLPLSPLETTGAPMKLKHLVLTVLTPTLLASTGVAFAQFQKPEDAIKYRQSAFTVMANSFGKIGAVVKGEVPFNKGEVANNAAIVLTLSKLPWQAFGPGTEGGNALPAIWSDNAKFKAASEKMQLAVVNLNTAAQSGDQEAIKKAFGAAGSTCKGCHDDFKKK
jgi:cytochrome c556